MYTTGATSARSGVLLHNKIKGKSHRVYTSHINLMGGGGPSIRSPPVMLGSRIWSPHLRLKPREMSASCRGRDEGELKSVIKKHAGMFNSSASAGPERITYMQLLLTCSVTFQTKPQPFKKSRRPMKIVLFPPTKLQASVPLRRIAAGGEAAELPVGLRSRFVWGTVISLLRSRRPFPLPLFEGGAVQQVPFQKLAGRRTEPRHLRRTSPPSWSLHGLAAGIQSPELFT